MRGVPRVRRYARRSRIRETFGGMENASAKCRTASLERSADSASGVSEPGVMICHRSPVSGGISCGPKGILQFVIARRENNDLFGDCATLRLYPGELCFQAGRSRPGMQAGILRKGPIKIDGQRLAREVRIVWRAAIRDNPMPLDQGAPECFGVAPVVGCDQPIDHRENLWIICLEIAKLREALSNSNSSRN